MSFILDALKKSESERNRQAGPALLEVRVAPRQARLPLWAIIILTALALNLIVIGYLLLRGRPTAPLPTPAPIAAAPAPVVAPPPAAVAAAPTAMPATLPDPALATTPLPPASSEAGAGINPADFAPAVPRSGGLATPTATAAQTAADLGLPSLNDLNANGAGLPELRLSLHVYDADPARRYVLLNSTRLRESETTPDGIRLERVTETGVILSWRGRRFTIPRGE
jgi:general secretion pathway protein B